MKEKNMSTIENPSHFMYPNLDRFQKMKLKRMSVLLQEIEKMSEIAVPDFLSYISVRYGIRRATGLEYLEDWSDGGYITINDNVIKFVKKPEWWK
jgi:hypothetical protein